MRRDSAACSVQRARCSVHRARLPVRYAPIVLAALVLSCSSPNQRAATPQAAEPAATDPQAVRPITLPDLSRVSPSVRQQLTEQYASLMTAIEKSTGSNAELSAAYGEMGKLLMAAEFPSEAEPCYLNAQALAPGDPRWSYYLGHLYRVKGDTAKAAALFERTLQLRPDDVPALIWLGETSLDQGRLDQATSAFSKALSLQPRLVAARVGLGRAALARRDFAGAVEQFESALALDRRASIVHYPLALAYRGLGKVDEAEVHLRQRGEVEIGPPDPLMRDLAESLHSASMFEARGDRALAAGDFKAALAAFQRGVELAPDNLTIRHKMATALSLTGDVRAAVLQFQEVLRRSPDFAGAHYSLAVLLLSNGQLDQAIERLAAAVRYDPTYLEARVQLANALRQRGRVDESLREYAETLKMDPRIGEARFGYALALVRLRRYEAARDSLVEDLDLYPGRTEFSHALARLLAAAPADRVRDGRRALALAQQLVREKGSPPSNDLRETMAMAFAESGQYEQAAAWQREAIAGAERGGRHDLAVAMTENLRLYERQKPCRVPWRDDPVWASF
jgi:tetratricopeptide (TPR) repeat protein